ncbi:MAG: hypothetical protein M3O46_22130 [Myxococcota bacterium]|nr:hypothetical protein [Myxococcota bacterium]
MPQKREVLQLLSRDELVALVQRFELSVADRRAKDGLVEAIAASKKATLVEVLPELSRDRLKELCRALDLDDSGREKSALVERLTGSKAAEPAPPSKKNGANGASSKAEPVEVIPGVKLTVGHLQDEHAAAWSLGRSN